MLAVKRNPWIFRRSRLQEVRRDNAGARAINAFAVRAVAPLLRGCRCRKR